MNDPIERSTIFRTAIRPRELIAEYHGKIMDESKKEHSEFQVESTDDHLFYSSPHHLSTFPSSAPPLFISSTFLPLPHARIKKKRINGVAIHIRGRFLVEALGECGDDILQSSLEFLAQRTLLINRS